MIHDSCVVVLLEVKLIELMLVNQNYLGEGLHFVELILLLEKSAASHMSIVLPSQT